ncbi:MAG TPA: N-6 DNA methylase [Candidatus Deferrimicrobiaceae bacterium]|jgi:hypothetical protein
MRRDNGIGFTALRTEGGILPSGFLQKVAALEANRQKGDDYWIARGLNLKDEIGRAWRIALAEWKEYRERVVRTGADPVKVGIESWLAQLLKSGLGFDDIAGAEAAILGGRTFPVRHYAAGGKVPLVMTTADIPLDKGNVRFGEEGRRRSPHALLQEFLNAEDASLWGIVSNGLVIRLLRKNPSLTRPAYVEANLERMFEEGLFSDFAAFWLIFHASRFGVLGEKPDGCILEQWRHEAQKTGERALAHLRDGVTDALRQLGNGFVCQTSNDALREALRSGSLSSQDYYRELLRLVYRFIFLLTVEDREVLHDDASDAEARDLYAQGYGIARLREQSLRRHGYDSYVDRWEALRVVFRGLADGAAPLALPPLGGLFAPGACPNLDGALIENGFLLRAIYALAFFKTGTALSRVNYRDMDTEELGSVYESLLELHPILSVEATPWTFAFVGDESGDRGKGSERKLSGSYYTPQSLVGELIKSALEPVIAKTLADHPADPRAALLSLKIIDPACGSGHFLLAAARRVAMEVARLDADADIPDELLRRHALREVVRYCIHGVDRNPLAVELCKTALWLETVEPGRPLGFLDAHIRCGDSLVGVRDLKILDDGIPDEAYAALSGDVKTAARDLKKRNVAGVKAVQGSLYAPAALKSVESTIDLDAMPEETIEQIQAKAAAWAKYQEAAETSAQRLAADLFTAAFFLPKTPEMFDRVPLTEDLTRAEKGIAMRPGVAEAVHQTSVANQFFHWPIAFRKVFSKGGFDVVLGNPPWEVSQLGEEEYFATISPRIAALAGAKRKKAIEALRTDAPAVWKQYEEDKRGSEAANQFIRESGQFRLTAFGKLNTYSLFSELFLNLLSPTGRAGIIVPTGIVTDDNTKVFFNAVASGKRLASLYDFENRDGIFPSVHKSYKFSLMTLGADIASTEFVFFAGDTTQLSDPHRRFTLSPNDIRLVNPNSKTCPVFRSGLDAELAKKIYRRVPVLIEEGRSAAGNPWGITFRQGLFNMASDSGLFVTGKELCAEGPVMMEDMSYRTSRDSRYVPLYEAKMVHQFDHRWATYESNGTDSRDVSDDDKSDPSYAPMPRYWVPEEEVEKRLNDKNWTRKWLMGWRDICRSTDERTMIAGVVPRVGTGDTFLLIMPGTKAPRLIACLLGNLNCLALDLVARMKVGGTHLKYHVMKQIAVLPPERYSQEDIEFIAPRVLELVYTADNLRPFAEDLGYTVDPFPWDPERRALLRAELDALYAKLYGLTRDDLRYILDPSEVFGPDFPGETFRVLKNNETRKFGEYRTQRLVLAAWDRLEQEHTHWG